MKFQFRNLGTKTWFWLKNVIANYVSFFIYGFVLFWIVQKLINKWPSVLQANCVYAVLLIRSILSFDYILGLSSGGFLLEILMWHSHIKQLFDDLSQLVLTALMHSLHTLRLYTNRAANCIIDLQQKLGSQRLHCTIAEPLFWKRIKLTRNPRKPCHSWRLPRHSMAPHHLD